MCVCVCGVFYFSTRLVGSYLQIEKKKKKEKKKSQILWYLVWDTAKCVLEPWKLPGFYKRTRTYTSVHGKAFTNTDAPSCLEHKSKATIKAKVNMADESHFVDFSKTIHNSETA